MGLGLGFLLGRDRVTAFASPSGPCKGPMWAQVCAPVLPRSLACLSSLTTLLPQHLLVSPGARRISDVFSPAQRRGQPWLPRCLPSPVSPERKWLPQAVKTGTFTLFWRGPHSSLSAHCKSTSTAPRPQLRIHSRLPVSSPEGTCAASCISGRLEAPPILALTCCLSQGAPLAPQRVLGHLEQKGTRMDLYRKPTGCECVVHWGPPLLGFGACSGAELGCVTQGSDRGGLALLVQINSFQD